MQEKIVIDLKKRSIYWDVNEYQRNICFDRSDLVGVIATVCVLLGVEDLDGLRDRVKNYVF